MYVDALLMLSVVWKLDDPWLYNFIISCKLEARKMGSFFVLSAATHIAYIVSPLNRQMVLKVLLFRIEKKWKRDRPDRNEQHTHTHWLWNMFNYLIITWGARKRTLQLEKSHGTLCISDIVVVVYTINTIFAMRCCRSSVYIFLTLELVNHQPDLLHFIL